MSEAAVLLLKLHSEVSELKHEIIQLREIIDMKLSRTRKNNNSEKEPRRERSGKKWEPEEDKRLEELGKTDMPYNEIAEDMKRSLVAVVTRHRNLFPHDFKSSDPQAKKAVSLMGKNLEGA